MGDLGVDTAVRAAPGGEPGRFQATLNRDWEIWGPMGGYVAAVALRAAGEVASFSRPASFACHYLGVASFDEPVDLEVTTLRSAHTAEALRVSITQDARPILDALVWTVADGIAGLEHDLAEAPDVPGPDGLLSVQERLGPDAPPPPFPFWNNFDGRPTNWREQWPPEGPLDPVYRNWLRFRPTATFADPWVDAGRALVVVDVQSWPAASSHHAWRQLPMIAPSLDLYVAFHRPAHDAEWVLADGHAPIAGAGLIGWTGRMWSADRQLLASGGGQLLCRPVRGT